MEMKKNRTLNIHSSITTMYKYADLLKGGTNLSSFPSTTLGLIVKMCKNHTLP